MSILPVSVNLILNCTINVVDAVLLLRLFLPLLTVVAIVQVLLEIQPTPDNFLSTAAVTLVWIDTGIGCVYRTVACVPKLSGRFNAKINYVLFV
jgi:hypothetical protein